jgi:streptogramin lyase
MTPVGIGIDGTGNAWVENLSFASITEIAPNGKFISPSSGCPGTSNCGYTGGGLNFPAAIAFDAFNNAWITNGAGNSVTEISPLGQFLSPTDGCPTFPPDCAYTGGGFDNPFGIALDPDNNAWIANPTNNTITEISSAGLFVSPSSGCPGTTNCGYRGGGLNQPRFIAIDSAGDVFIVNANSTVVEMSPAAAFLSGSRGYQGGGLNQPQGIAIDASGNVWLPNDGGGGNSVTQFVGLAAPVLTPASACLVRHRVQKELNTTMVRTRQSEFLAAALLTITAMLLAGCGGGGSSIPAGTISGRVNKISGIVHGGQNPVAGTQVIATQAGSSGYGKGNRGFACTTTNANGQFTFGSAAPICPGFPGLSTSLVCPSTGSPDIYLFALGGNPGSGLNNAALTMIAPLGNCNSLPSGLTVTINEVTTVATVWALSQFMNCATGSVNGTVAGCTSASRDIGTSPTNATGLANAIGVAGNLANFSTGAAQGILNGGGLAPPTMEINTLGDILQDCVNSTGAASTACQNLFSCVVPGAKPAAGNSAPCTIPAGGVMPSDTLTAALDIARNPANNLATLFKLISKTPAFTPPLASAPNDWTAAVVLSSAMFGTSGPLDSAIDAQSNAWFPAGFELVEVSPTGEFISGGVGYPIKSTSVASDTLGDVWTSNFDGNSVTRFNPSVGGVDFTGLGLTGPAGLAIDGSGNIWITNSGDKSLTKIDSMGDLLSPSGGFTGGGLNAPFRIALDVVGNAWVINSGASTISELSATGNALSGTTGYTGGGLNSPTDIAIDPSANIWVTNASSNTTGNLAEFSSGGIPISPATGFNGGLKHPDGLAIDAAGNVWVTNTFGNSVVEFNAAGVPISGPTGYQTGSGTLD